MSDKGRECRKVSWTPPGAPKIPKVADVTLPAGERAEIQKEIEYRKEHGEIIIEKREPVQKVQVTCTVCHQPKWVYPSEVGMVTSFACGDCLSKFGRR